MNKAIELVLTNLIPRHSGALPPELLDLTSSLLAQSRIKCSLNAEQEIGRTYACAHLACERLKTTLNLPAIEPRPPVPPRVYKKLYAYIESSLASGTPRKRSRYTDPRSGSNTPSKKSSLSQQNLTPSRNDTPTQKSIPIAQRGTPSKQRSLASFRTPKKGLRFEKRDQEKIPRWVGVVGREMCKALRTPNAIPHVLAGMESLIFLDVERDAEERMGRWPALMIAVWAYVRKKLMPVGTVVTKEEFAERREEAERILLGARKDERLVERAGNGKESWDGWDLLADDEGQDGDGNGNGNEMDVNDWIKEINAKGWLEMDWYVNIAAGGGLDGEDERLENRDEDEATMDEGFERVLVREDEMRYGLGTMRQKRVDYLTDKKRAAYQVWEKAMLDKIERILRGGTQDVDGAISKST